MKNIFLQNKSKINKILIGLIHKAYLIKLKNSKITLNNTTLVPYDLQMINFKLLTKKNINFIRNYHIDIHNKYMSYFTEDEKKIFKKYFLIN